MKGTTPISPISSRASLKILKKLINEAEQSFGSNNILTKITNSYFNYKASKILSTKLHDFSEYHLPSQIKIIYEDTRLAILRKEYPIIIRSIANFKVYSFKLVR
jgi:hypothetical protein